MEIHDLILRQDEAALLDQCLLRFLEDTGVRLALVVSRDGHALSQAGMYKGLDIMSLSALSVGAFASSEALAHLAGEESFTSIFHQGMRSSMYISAIGDSYLLLCLFDYNASAPLVRLQARVITEAIIDILERAATRTQSTRVGA